MPTYLLEIGTEELPADRVTEAQERLKTLVADGLKKAAYLLSQLLAWGRRAG